MLLHRLREIPCHSHDACRIGVFSRLVCHFLSDAQVPVVLLELYRIAVERIVVKIKLHALDHFVKLRLYFLLCASDVFSRHLYIEQDRLVPVLRYDVFLRRDDLSVRQLSEDDLEVTLLDLERSFRAVDLRCFLVPRQLKLALHECARAEMCRQRQSCYDKIVGHSEVSDLEVPDCVSLVDRISVRVVSDDDLVSVSVLAILQASSDIGDSQIATRINSVERYRSREDLVRMQLAYELSVLEVSANILVALRIFRRIERQMLRDAAVRRCSVVVLRDVTRRSEREEACIVFFASVRHVSCSDVLSDFQSDVIVVALNISVEGCFAEVDRVRPLVSKPLCRECACDLVETSENGNVLKVQIDILLRQRRVDACRPTLVSLIGDRLDDLCEEIDRTRSQTPVRLALH